MSVYTEISFYVNQVTFFLLFLTFFVGIVGNILSFKVFSTPNLSRQSFSLYFRVMALNDLAISVLTLGFIVIYVFEFNFKNVDFLLCTTYDYISYVLSPVSAYLLVTISIDRFVKIKFQNRLSFLFKRSVQITLISSIYVYNMIFYNGFYWN
jgi:hypothetical protein